MSAIRYNPANRQTKPERIKDALPSTEMVTLLITAVAVLVLFGIGVYFWQKPASDDAANVLPPRPNARGLFEEEPSKETADAERRALISQRREKLIREAGNGNLSTLDEAHLRGETDLYDRVLAALVQVSDSNPKLLSLLSYVSQNELPVNKSLAEAVLASWRKAPDRSGTARALHFAALSDDPDIYRGAVESAVHLWRTAKLADISAIELRALFDGEFWVLSSRSRSSGAGFVLKRTLDGARRELEAAAGANQ
jgi:hypothetical protein